MSEWKWDKTKTDFEPMNGGPKGNSPSTHFQDLTGERYGRLITEYPIRIKKRIYWVCKCD